MSIELYIDNGVVLGTSVSIIISTMALTVPLILQMISRINTQYDSIVLIEFFMSEMVFKTFKVILLASIIMLFIWIPTNFYHYECIYEICSLVLILLTFILVITLTLLIKLCVDYNSPAALFYHISHQHKRDSKKKAIETFYYKSKDIEQKYIDAYITLFKYAVNSDKNLTIVIAKFMSSIFNTYRNGYYKYLYPKNKDRFVQYPPSYYQLINILNCWILEEDREDIYAPNNTLTWLYDTNEHQTYLSKSSIQCIWNNISLYTNNHAFIQVEKFYHYLFHWAYKWSTLYDNNKYDYKHNIQYKQECESIRVLVYVTQTYWLKQNKTKELDNLWKSYNCNDTVGKYSKLFFPKSLEDMLDAYSSVLSVLSTDYDFACIFVDDNIFKSQSGLLDDITSYFAHRFCVIYPKFDYSDIQHFQIESPLFLSFPRGSVFKFMTSLKNNIEERGNYNDIDVLFKEVAAKIDQANTDLISSATFNQQMLLDYFSTIQGSIKQLYSHTLLYCDVKNRSNKTHTISIPLIRRGENKRYFIDIDHIAGNAYFREFANRLRTKFENIVFDAITTNLGATNTYYSDPDDVVSLVRKIITEEAQTKDVIIINAFNNLDSIKGVQLIMPKKTNKIIARDKYRIDKINIVDIPKSQSYREKKHQSLYIIKKKEAPFLQVYNPMEDLNSEDWICANRDQQIYLRLGETYENPNGNVHVAMEMLVGTRFFTNPQTNVWRIIITKKENNA